MEGNRNFRGGGQSFRGRGEPRDINRGNNRNSGNNSQASSWNSSSGYSTQDSGSGWGANNNGHSDNNYSNDDYNRFDDQQNNSRETIDSGWNEAESNYENNGNNYENQEEDYNQDDGNERRGKDDNRRDDNRRNDNRRDDNRRDDNRRDENRRDDNRRNDNRRDDNRRDDNRRNENRRDDNRRNDNRRDDNNYENQEEDYNQDDGNERRGKDDNRRDDNRINDNNYENQEENYNNDCNQDDGNERRGKDDNRRDDNKRNDNRRDDNRRDNNRRNDNRRDDNGRDDNRRDDNAGGDDENNGEEGELPKKIEFYIPPELGNEENDVFSSGITTGINFEKFDDIKVEINGDNLPNIISSFQDIKLRPILMNNIKRSTYTKPTPIQRYALSIVMSGRDLMACAQTGSGKTAAFLLPIINNLLEHPTDLIVDAEHVEPQAVIVSPTRELAIQIYQEARKFSFDSDIKVALVYGGAATGHQRRSIERGCHILIATPGRMLDFVKRGWVTFSSIRFVVLDEADRMLNMGFLPSMKEMFEHPTMIPTGERRTLMFSATFPQDVQTLASEFLQDYIFVTVGIIGSASTDVEQVFLQVGQLEKRPKLLEILENYGTPGTLIFVETKRNADFLAIYLSEQNFKINSIHGDRTQREREEAIRDFKTGKCDILVATSVAARGLDIPNVKHVINFDLPVSEIEEYIHRIGRTGRIGNKGMATSFFDDDLNSRNAEAYARILEQAEQNVPDWLRSGGGKNNFNRNKPSFGGRDIRHNHKERPPKEMW